MTFGDSLKDLIEDRGISVAELSRKTGINKNTLYSYIRRNTQKPDPSVLQALAEALDVDVYYFLGTKKDTDDDLFKKTKRFRRLVAEKLNALDSADFSAAGIGQEEVARIAYGDGGIPFEQVCEAADKLGISIDREVLTSNAPIREDERTPEVTRLFARLDPAHQATMLQVLRGLLADQQTHPDSRE